LVFIAESESVMSGHAKIGGLAKKAAHAAVMSAHASVKSAAHESHGADYDELTLDKAYEVIGLLITESRLQKKKEAEYKKTCQPSQNEVY